MKKLVTQLFLILVSIWLLAACSKSDKVSEQKKMDPLEIIITPEIEKQTKIMLDKFKGLPHIANLGHGVYPDIHPDAVRCFINAVKSY